MVAICICYCSLYNTCPRIVFKLIITWIVEYHAYYYGTRLWACQTPSRARYSMRILSEQQTNTHNNDNCSELNKTIILFSTIYCFDCQKIIDCLQPCSKYDKYMFIFYVCFDSQTNTAQLHILYYIYIYYSFTIVIILYIIIVLYCVNVLSYYIIIIYRYAYYEYCYM